MGLVTVKIVLPSFSNCSSGEVPSAPPSSKKSQVVRYFEVGATFERPQVTQPFWDEPRTQVHFSPDCRPLYDAVLSRVSTASAIGFKTF